MGENLDVPGRLSVRTPMQWQAGDNAGFSTSGKRSLVRPVTEGAYGPDEVNVAQQRSDPDSLWSFVQRLISRYRQSPEIGWSSVEVLDSGDHRVLAHVCRKDEWSLVALHNFAAEPVEVTVEVPGLTRGHRPGGPADAGDAPAHGDRGARPDHADAARPTATPGGGSSPRATDASTTEAARPARPPRPKRDHRDPRRLPRLARADLSPTAAPRRPARRARGLRDGHVLGPLRALEHPARALGLRLGVAGRCPGDHRPGDRLRLRARAALPPRRARAADRHPGPDVPRPVLGGARQRRGVQRAHHRRALARQGAADPAARGVRRGDRPDARR